MGDYCEVSKYIKRWSPVIFTLVTDNFLNYRFFGVSALGIAPSPDDNKPIGVFPYRVEEPFLWIMRQLNMLEARRR